MQWLVKEIVSGGQTGADRAGLEVAIQIGIPHGGWCPKDRWAEDGRIHQRYQLKEVESVDIGVRTEWNVRDSDGTIVFAQGVPTGGSADTVQFTKKYKRPCLVVDVSLKKPDKTVKQIQEWIKTNQIKVLNIAGSRESKNPGIYQAVKDILIEVFNLTA